jgi:transketolase
MMAEMQMREAYGRALVAYGEVNPDLVVLDADTSASTLTNLFAQRYPERFLNLGIAEPCMVDVAVGLALGGKLPFATAFAALLVLRAMEQIRTCVCYGQANVKLAGSYAGLSDYKDGPTHHSITDIAMMRTLPHMTVVVPADASAVTQAVRLVAEHDGPVYLRLSRDAAIPVHGPDLRMEIGQGITVREGDDLTIVACGTMVGRSLRAAEALATQGIRARVIDMHTVKPLDKALLLQAAEETGAIVTAEEHSILGGLGGAVAEALCEARPVVLERVGVADRFACTAFDASTLMDAHGLAIEDVVDAAQRCLARKEARS